MLNRYSLFTIDQLRRYTMHSLFNFIQFVIDLYIIVVIVRVVLSWIPHDRQNSIIQFIYQLTEPPLSWIRQWIPNLGGLDISPIILILALTLIKRILF